MAVPHAPLDIQSWLQADGSDLPSLPPVAGELVALADDPGEACERLAEVIMREPVLAGRILRLVNSAYFGLPHKVTDIRHAVFLTGFRTVRTVILTAATLSAFRDLELAAFDLTRFWRHSISAAAVCRTVAKRTEEVDPETAFSLGLLHDIGKLLLVRYRPEEAEQVIHAAERGRLSFFQAEQAALPATHPDLGAWLARRWGLPPVLVAGLAQHHAVPRDDLPPLQAALRFADYLCTIKGLTASGSCADAALDRQTWTALQLTTADLPPLINVIDAEIKTAEDLLRNA